MPQKPSPEEIDRMHRWFAVECNNNTWGLIDRRNRTETENRDMLYLAYAAAFHWSKIGAPINDARADALLAHVHAMLGHADLSLMYAKRCLFFCENNHAEDWDLAFAHAELRHAAIAAGDRALYAKHDALARKCGESIQAPDDRKVFFDEFAKLPKLA